MDYCNNRIKIFIIGFVLFLGLHTNCRAENLPATAVAWDENKRELSYNLTEQAVVKVRAGRDAGPIYETLVNLEQKLEGTHKQSWPAEGAQGKIDFTQFGPMHFCVDTNPKPVKDLQLVAHSLEEEKQPVTSSSFNLDIKEKDKANFVGPGGFEIRSFIDGDLIKVDNVKQLPYALDIDPQMFSSGEHLLSINVWPLPERANVAYKNILIAHNAEQAEQSAADLTSKAHLTGALAFCQHTNGYWQVFLSDLDGANTKQLTDSPVDKLSLAFSPSGKIIVYTTSTGELWSFNRENKQKQRIPLPVNCTEPSFSMDEKKIVFTSFQDLYHGDSELWTLEFKSNALEKIISRPWLQYNPTFSPDGNYVIFVDGPELYGQEIRKLHLATKEVTQLTDNQPYDYDMQPCFSPEGKKIFYSSDQSGNYDIWQMDKFGQHPRNLTKHQDDDRMPQITPDGRNIYFLSDRSGSVQVWQMEANGTNPKQITNTESDLHQFALYTVK